MFNRFERAFPVVRLGGPLRGYRMRLDWRQHRSFVYGTWEPDLVRAIERGVRPGWLAVEAGAHIGYFTLLLAHQVGPGGTVVAFEPLPSNFRLLAQNVELNGLTNVLLDPRALAEGPGSRDLFRRDTDETSFAGSLVWPGGETVPVHTVALDDAMSDRAQPVGVVKIDVEGAEEFVIAGMRGILRSDRPLLFMELHGVHHTNRASSLWTLLRDLGYGMQVLAVYDAATLLMCTPGRPDAQDR